MAKHQRLDARLGCNAANVGDCRVARLQMFEDSAGVWIGTHDELDRRQ